MSPITALTYVLPHRLVSSIARRLAYSTRPAIKQWLIDTVTRKFNVNLAEAAQPDPTAYPTFNAFFTRALKPGARVADADPRSVLMPADGRISECGHIGRSREGVLHEEAGHIFQAKGHGFTTAQLLADDAAARAFDGGVYATVYLSPRDYHRVHMPWSGTLRETVHVPGRLFSVGTDAVGSVSALFARNERLVCHFDCDFGPMAVVMVGALLVSGVETVWGGVEIPPYGGPIVVKDYRGQGIALERFAEMARFNYGSTAIVLLPAGVADLVPELRAQAPVQLGQALARLN
ncbi:archaetidylserine decarboxylase [Agrilutibacter solisilvae]|uniref:Phosphatidylserine decarboxylase proenzyme n=1 Tax=Agrilutibacter solisilvae TaxID=2763317 RepID=A0A975ARL5_9GAMM|nr:archaetidylserine decarboxylase [Lysobacter solisilvae]QSX77363.1 phosphatidylserine decarboxylase [Lysobacter solisilvae]